MRNKGIVVKIKDSHCIILSGDGSYHKIPCSRVTNPRVGAQTEFFPVNWVNRLNPLLMVASLLVVFLGLNVYRMAALASPAAYVSLDINPSVELAVDKNTKVITVLALNQDAEKLLNGMDLKGKDLYLAVREILSGAAASGYIRPEETNYILSTVTPGESSPDQINYDSMADKLEKSIDNKDLDINLVVLSADVNTRKEAKNKGISAGKFLVYKNSIDSGKEISLEQVKQTSITKLVNNGRVLLTPGKKKGFVKLIRVPRKNGHLKKSGLKQDDSSSVVDPNLTTPVQNIDGQNDQPSENKDPKVKSEQKGKMKQKDKNIRQGRDNTGHNAEEITNDSLNGTQSGKNKQSRSAGPIEEDTKELKPDQEDNDQDQLTDTNNTPQEKHKKPGNTGSKSKQGHNNSSGSKR